MSSSPTSAEKRASWITSPARLSGMFKKQGRGDSKEGTAPGSSGRDTSASTPSITSSADPIAEDSAEDLSSSFDIDSQILRTLKSLRPRPWQAERFEHHKKLQEAARNQGSVELMMHKGGGVGFVAVKCMPNKWMMSSAEEFSKTYPTSSEQPWFDIGMVKVLNDQSFPYALKLYGLYQDNEKTYVVNELASEGDLFGWCDSFPGYGVQREKVIAPLARQMFSAVAWLHDIGIAHRDLSLENVLLHRPSKGDPLQVKIIDFGMASLERECENEIRGKQSYQAPEMHVKNSPYDPFVSDVFALGVLLFCLAAQDYPWVSTAPGTCQLYQFVSIRGLRPFLEKRKLRKGDNGEKLSEVFSKNFTELMEGMLTVSPNKRITLGERCFLDRGRRSVWDAQWLNDW